MFYRIINNQAPLYLCNLLPQRAADRHPYRTRRADNFIHFHCRTESFARSFFPKTLLEFEALPANIKEAQTLRQFKSEVANLFPSAKVPKWFLIGPRVLNILICRMRNKCSSLKQHLFRHHLSDNPICDNCNVDATEDNEHFLLGCIRFNDDRMLLLDSINEIYRAYNIPANVPITTDILLCGQDGFSENFNLDILNQTQHFISRTKRFS